MSESAVIVSFDSVPDHVPPVENGTYILEITNEPEIKENKHKTGFNLVPVLKISSNADGSDTPMKGRQVTDYISLSEDPNSLGNVRLKHLIRSSGVKTDDIRVSTFSELVTAIKPRLTGARVKAEVKQNPGKDAAGNDAMFANIKQYMYSK